MRKYPRLNGESDEEYKYRICAMKAQIGTWYDVADVINEELGVYYDECVYRKSWAAFQKLAAASQLNLDNAEEVLNDIKEQRRELEKEKVKFRDERNEVSRLYRARAREESYHELIERKIAAYEPKGISFPMNNNVELNGKDMIVHLTDLHIGIKIDNGFNKYNEQILENRLGIYLNKICEVANLHKPEHCFVVIGGDCISGIIHNNLRLENNENVVDQIMTASEYLSAFVHSLSILFAKVFVYSVAGNHSRVFQSKEDAAKGENLDNLIPFYMKARLQNDINVNICSDNAIDESIGHFICRGKLVYFVHGDKDNEDTMVQKLSAFTGKKPDVILTGHKHTNSLSTSYGVKVVQSGCLSGMDSYCVDKRLMNRPEQTILIMDDGGIDCIYDVKLG